MQLISTTPGFPVKSIEKAVDFYTSKLGFTCTFKDTAYGILKRDQVEIHLWPANSRKWIWRSLFLFLKPVRLGNESFLAGSQSCRILVEDLDGLYYQVKPHGILHRTSQNIIKTSWDTREFSVLDPYRNLITFYEPVDPVVR